MANYSYIEELTKENIDESMFVNNYFTFSFGTKTKKPTQIEALRSTKQNFKNALYFFNTSILFTLDALNVTHLPCILFKKFSLLIGYNHVFLAEGSVLTPLLLKKNNRIYYTSAIDNLLPEESLDILIKLREEIFKDFDNVFDISGSSLVEKFYRKMPKIIIQSTREMKYITSEICKAMNSESIIF